MTEDRKPGPDEGPDTGRPARRRIAVVLGVLGVVVLVGVLVVTHFQRQARSPQALDTALRTAISSCDAEGVRTAIAHGADPNRSPRPPQGDIDGVQPLQRSRPVQAYISCPTPEVLQTMEDAGANLAPDLRRLADRAMRPARPLVMVWLLDNGVSPNIRWPNAEGWESLSHRAARRAEAGMLRVLLNAGADPNTRDSAGLTPLGRVRHDIARARMIMTDSEPTLDSGNLANDLEQRFAEVIAMLHEAGGTE